MSATSGVVTEAHFRYLAERTTREDAFLVSLKAAAQAEGIPPIWISAEQASLMQILLRAAKAREVVEVGTLAGYSAICMARALPAGGHVTTIEIEPKHARFAQAWADKSDAAGKVIVKLGPGREVLPTLPPDSADACFIDADKAGYACYLDECLRIVRVGGLILVDNAFAFGQLFDDKPTDSGVAHVKAFNDKMAADRRVRGIIVPIGDGCWVGVRES